MRFYVRFEVIYRNGSKRTKTRMVDARSAEQAFQLIKDQQFQDYSVEEIELVSVTKM